MKVTIKLLAIYGSKLPEGVKDNTIDIEISDNTMIEDILQMFDIPGDNQSVVLVNGHAPLPDQQLQQGDVICAFPAIAGG